MKVFYLMLLSGVYLFLAFSMETPVARAIFLAVAVWLFIWGYKELKENAENKEKKLQIETENKLNKIPHTHYVISDDYLTGLLIDEESEKLHVIKREGVKEEFQIDTFHFHEILEAALIENDKIQSLISKGAKNQNAIIYGKIEEKEELSLEKEGVHKISLKLIVNNLTKPEIEYVFFESEHSINQDSEEYEQIMEICKDWFQKISVIIKRTELIPVRKWV